MNKKQGFTLIELIMFIIIIGILATTILVSSNTVLRGTGRLNYQSAATDYAATCLEWFLGQRAINGFSSIACNNTTTPTFCNVPSGYTISTNVACTTYNGDSSDYKTITAVIDGGYGDENLSVVIANY
jgi:prepilin-type N-terminal cleavage/methylation domain-containing protein